MKKTLVFGVGNMFSSYLYYILENYNVSGFLDNDKDKQGQSILGKEVYSPEDIDKLDYDEILLVSIFHDEMHSQLIDLGVPNSKINKSISDNLDIMRINHKLGGLTNKTVLDVGCGDVGNERFVKQIASYFKPSMIIGIDPSVQHEEKGDNYLICNGRGEDLAFDDNSFDAVYSTAAFEHIEGIEETLSEIKRVLKPFGKFYCSFGHVWTSVNGYHDDGTEADLLSLPPWGHLYMSEFEMKEYMLMSGLTDGRVRERLDFIRENLNHHSRTRLTNWIVNSGMLVREYGELPKYSRKEYADGTPANNFHTEMTKEILDIIGKTEYSEDDLYVSLIGFLLEKIAL